MAADLATNPLDTTQPANSQNTTGTLAGGNVTNPNSTTTASANPSASPLSVAQTGVTNSNLTTAVQPTAGLVSNNVNSLIDQNSPLMQRAAAKANEQANSRGVLNSSMAIGDAQNAVIANALPIAQSDAASQNQFALTNASAANQNSQFNTGQTNTVNTQNTGAVNTAVGQQQQQLATTGQQANANMQTAATEHDRQVAAIMTDANMTTNAKNAAVATLNANYIAYQQSYAALGTMGVTGLVDFSKGLDNTPGAANPVAGSNASTVANNLPGSLPVRQVAFDTQLNNLNNAKAAEIAAIVPTGTTAAQKNASRIQQTNAINTKYAQQITALGTRPTV